MAGLERWNSWLALVLCAALSAACGASDAPSSPSSLTSDAPAADAGALGDVPADSEGAEPADVAEDATATVADVGSIADVAARRGPDLVTSADVPVADAPAPSDAGHAPDVAVVADVPAVDAAPKPDVVLVDLLAPKDVAVVVDVATPIDIQLTDVAPLKDSIATADVAKPTDIKADTQPDSGPTTKPVCKCFVQSAWCGAGAAKEAATLGCSIPLLPAHNGDILGCNGSTWIVQKACALGCVQAPKGTPDTCKVAPPKTCTLLAGTAGAQLKWGLHPDASNALRKLGIKATGISQTIGNAPASAGTHLQDGTAKGYAYSAATDLRTLGMTAAQVKTLLQNLAEVGFVAWYRKPGSDGWPSNGAYHIHAIWVSAPMKLSLRNQVHSFMAGKNGLKSNATYTFYTWSQCWRDALWKAFIKVNPAAG